MDSKYTDEVCVSVRATAGAGGLEAEAGRSAAKLHEARASI
jgi:hypothetical protein